MAKQMQQPKTQPKSKWLRMGLIGSALLLLAVIAVEFFRRNTEAPSAPSRSTPVPAAPTAPSNPTARIKVPAKVLETSFPTLDGKPQRLAD